MSEIVEKILKIFEDKKLIGKQDIWGIDTANGEFVQYPGCYVCGLAALLLGQPCVYDGVVLDDYERAVRLLIGLSEGYVEGYVSGFDGSEPSKNPTNEYAIGFEDGRSTWNALVKKKRVYISEETIEREMAEPDYNDSQQ